MTRLGVLGIIPARRCSKGFPRKNVAMLDGSPLVVHTIETARRSESLSRIVLSTDDDEIAEIGKVLGVEVPFMRPTVLAGDNTPSVEVVRHCLDWLRESEAYLPDIVVLLQPTSPLRRPSDVDAAVDLLCTTGCDSVVSLTQVHQHPYHMYTIERGVIKPFTEIGICALRRQDLPPVYSLNGALYVSKVDLIYESATLIGNETRAIVMPRSRGIDIDEPLDLELAEMILRKENKA